MRAWPLLAAMLLPGCGGQTESEPPYPTSGCPPSHESVDGRCKTREVFIPGGQFLIGAGHCPKGRILEIPPEVHDCPLADAPRVVTVKPFWVDVAPLNHLDLAAYLDVVTYPDCLDADLGCTGRAYEPVSLGFAAGESDTDLIVASLEKLCAEWGKRWLTEVEWEYLATGGGTRKFPWGDREPRCTDGNFDLERCGARNADERGVSLVASYAPSPEGVYDLFGGYWEMLAPSPEAYDDGYTPVPLNLPKECGGAYKCEWQPGAPITVARGASRNTPVDALRADYRSTTHSNEEGFTKLRCARDAE